MTRWAILAVLAAAQFLMVLDQAVMNVAISQLVEDFDTTVTTIQAVIAFYALVMASLMLIGGKLGDKLGRRRAFLIGICIYAVGSGLTAAAWNVPSAFRHCCSQRRQISAQILQCSWRCACLLHSASHEAQITAHASSCARSTPTSASTNRESTEALAEQMSAQSRFNRMQRRSAATCSSARQASAHKTHASAHSMQAAIQSTNPAFAVDFRGLAAIIRSTVCMDTSW